MAQQQEKTVTVSADDLAAMQKRLSQLEQQVAGIEPAKRRVDPLSMDRGSVREDKRKFIKTYEVSFWGPKSGEFHQPITVEALDGPQAVATVYKHLGLAELHRYRAEATCLGDVWEVRPAGTAELQGFPVRVAAPDAKIAAATQEKIHGTPMVAGKPGALPAAKPAAENTEAKQHG